MADDSSDPSEPLLHRTHHSDAIDAQKADRKVELLCCGLMFLSGALYSCTIPFLASMVTGRLGRSQKELGFLFAFYPVGSLVFNPVVGYLTGRYLQSAAPSTSKPTLSPLERRRLLLLVALCLAFSTCVFYSVAPSFELLCFAKLMQALTDAITWICTLETWERYCAGRNANANSDTRDASHLPNVSTGSTRILASSWVGQIVALPLAGYLYDRGDWVFLPAAVVAVALGIGWSNVNLGVGSELTDTGRRSEDYERLSTADPDRYPHANASTHPLPPSSSSERTSLLPSTSSSLLAVPLFCATFVSSGLEPTLPQFLRDRLGATPTEIGGLYYVSWSVSLIAGMLCGGALIEEQEREDGRRASAVLIGGMTSVAVSAPMAAARWELNWNLYDLAAPSDGPPLALRVAEIVALCLLGFALGLVIAPTLPEMTAAAKRERERDAERLGGVGDGANGHVHNGGGLDSTPDGTSVPSNQRTLAAPLPNADESTASTLYGFWCFVYSAGMAISQPLSTVIYDKLGFQSLMLVNSALMVLVGIPSIIIYSVKVL
ncbi:MFS general substrate transporter [Gonapodya prolifera JEL478]|uniref:MFS general substrate transporter n=1 Tax=Gonapodya prolifera (strain JEL478) TaxID=1344416 RepID=A0A139A398_GONPJ|nr:MFS general substrate transporter [Gonapodya prolifera JEL478]|eukprot:KXS11240.1 MFS general substrate transporter [Gonapodya prolifera JEL478]